MKNEQAIQNIEANLPNQVQALLSREIQQQLPQSTDDIRAELAEAKHLIRSLQDQVNNIKPVSLDETDAKIRDLQIQLDKQDG